MKNEHFYAGAKKYDFSRSLARNADILTENDIELIQRYISEMEATRHISEPRARKIGITLVGLRRFIPVPWNRVTLDDVYKGIAALKSGKSARGKPFKPNTLHDTIKLLKTFLIWLNDEGIIEINEKKVRAIRAPAVDVQTVPASDLLTPGEIEALIKAAPNDRDRALIYTLYESGCRIQELANLTWKDLIFDEYGVRVYIPDFKTNKRRYARLTASTESLAALKNHCQGKPEPDAYVFLNNDGNPMTYISCFRVLERAAKKAGMEKAVRPHLLRHSRITQMVRDNYQESIIKESMWGNLNTKQFKTYVALSEAEIDAEYLKRAGMEIKDNGKTDVALKPRTCGECHTINASISNYCSKCGRPLTEQAATSLKEAEHAVELMPEYQEILKMVEANLMVRQTEKTGSS